MLHHASRKEVAKGLRAGRDNDLYERASTFEYGYDEVDRTYKRESAIEALFECDGFHIASLRAQEIVWEFRGE
jgi:hypothetical protein